MQSSFLSGSFPGDEWDWLALSTGISRWTYPTNLLASQIEACMVPGFESWTAQVITVPAVEDGRVWTLEVSEMLAISLIRNTKQATTQSKHNISITRHSRNNTIFVSTTPKKQTLVTEICNARKSHAKDEWLSHLPDEGSWIGATRANHGRWSARRSIGVEKRSSRSDVGSYTHYITLYSRILRRRT